MKNLSGRRAFRVVREVQITRVELVNDFPSGQISTPGHKEPLHGWDLAQAGRVVSIEEVALPDEATLAQAPHVQVEYILPNMSREHDGISAYVPLPLIEVMGSVEAAFEICTDKDRSTIVYSDESLDTLYTAEGAFWEGEEDVVYLLPGQQTDLRSFVRYVVERGRTPLVTRFVLGDCMVEWGCLTVGGERVGADAFDVYQGKEPIGCEHMHREVVEDALLAIAAHIAPGRRLEDIVGRVS
jgi:hypothetical protein